MQLYKLYYKHGSYIASPSLKWLVYPLPKDFKGESWAVPWFLKKNQHRFILPEHFQIFFWWGGGGVTRMGQGCHGQGKSSGKWKKIQVREKSGNFIFSQGNLEK